MKDTKLQTIVLQLFYDRRKEISFCPRDTDFKPPIPFADVMRICDQLAEQGLIDWKPTKGPGGVIIHGYGKITGAGVAVVETPPAELDEMTAALGKGIGGSIAEAFYALEGVVYAMSKQPNFDKAEFLKALRFIYEHTPVEQTGVRTFYEVILERLPRQ